MDSHAAFNPEEYDAMHAQRLCNSALWNQSAHASATLHFFPCLYMWWLLNYPTLVMSGCTWLLRIYTQLQGSPARTLNS